MRLNILTIVAVISLTGTEGFAASRWTIYEDANSNCLLEYPAGLFRPEAGQRSDEPRRFSGPDAHVYFRIKGVKNPHGWSPRAIKEKFLSKDVPGDVSYDRTRRDFFVVSGYRGADIFYTKVALSSDRSSACVLEITYPRVQKKSFDQIVTRISRSFRSLN
jgi:hypothetical protein